MPKIYSEALDRHIETDRIIGHIKGSQPGPTLIFVGGIHGNEPSGVFAIHQVFQELEENKTIINGSIYGLAGNLWALERGERYHKKDLNRLWTSARMKRLNADKMEAENEDEAQQIELFKIIQLILDKEKGPFYFMDLHTTSSKTMPFLTVNDSLLNRKFVKNYPVPIILGIEEYLDGPLLSYINEIGYVAFGFESGQHTEMASIENHVAFIYYSLTLAGSIEKEKTDTKRYYNLLLKRTRNIRSIYEIYFRHAINEGDEFIMEPNFDNFQRVTKRQKIATSNGKSLYAKKKGRIFMPLYQAKGDDGFFAIRRIRSVYLVLSTIFRKLHIDVILPLLPGVKWASDKHDILLVDRRTARFFAKKIFHLMGYRSKTIDANYLTMKNREAVSRTKDYRNASWF